MPLLFAYQHWPPSSYVSPGVHKNLLFVLRFKCISSRNRPRDNIIRLVANYHRNVWTPDFVESLQDYYKEKIHSRQAEKLKEKVADMLNDETMDSLTKLTLIDDLQRLGVGYHFEKETTRALDILLFNKDKCIEDGLYSAALYFRLLRQHGYNVSQDIFNDFKDGEGLRLGSCEDVKGLLSLYEASNLGFGVEDFLQEAKQITVKQLKLLHGCTDPTLAEEVHHALELPLHWRMPRLEARRYIEMYERKAKMSLVLLELARLDFNYLQAIHKKELKNMSRWWNYLGLSENLSFARDRLVESFLFSVGLAYKPQHQCCREWMTKVISLVLTIDDMYDIHGSVDELEPFTAAVERWDPKTMGKLPKYMRICFLALFNTTNDMVYTKFKEQEQELYILPYLHKTWADFCKAMLVEVKWSKMGYMPSLTEYLQNAWVSSSTTVGLVHAFFGTHQRITNDLLKCLDNNPDLIYYSAMIVRLCNDLATSTVELERGDVPSAIQCYMHEANVPENVARDKIKSLISETWKNLNESTYNSPFEHSFIDIAMNAARTAHIIYQRGDGISVQNQDNKNLVARLLVKPITFSNGEISGVIQSDSLDLL